MRADNQSRALELLSKGITTRSHIAQKSGLTQRQVTMAICKLRYKGLIGEGLRPTGKCLLSEIWR